MSIKPLTYLFKDDGRVPNNPALPVLVYKGAVDVESPRSAASTIEKQFSDNDWGNGQWRNGIYPFVHYHSMIHEALGISSGHARVQLGGHVGEVFELKAGDVVVLPAGTGH
ncbi:MAG: cupin, partial [Pseudolabrys sp.]